ncbi:MAG: transketolase [Synergistaceae bacterium]|nr:transketolase [Synergistaceae bacterium]
MDPTNEIRGFKAAKICPEMMAELKEKARKGRVWSVIATSAAKSGHPGGALSSMDIYMTLLAVADISPDRSDCMERDRIVISHGHTSAGFYSALAAYGFFAPEDMYANFRRTCSPFQGHVEREVPGVDWGTGNLGQGLSAGVGFALAARARGSNSKTWVVMGDGEQVKGQVSEARRIAAKEKLNNLTVLVDWNDIQISGRIEEVMPVNIPALWKADGWHVIECDGHSCSQIYDAMRSAATHEGCYVILCRTVMGKGVSFMQNISDYHGKAASGDNLAIALSELGADMGMFEKALEIRKGELPKGREITRCAPELETGVPVTYTIEDKKDNRGAFGKALAQVGELNYKKEGRTPMIVFDCDLAGSVKVDGFAKVCPDNFIQSGIQEHATATVAGAASAAGVVSVWAAFGVFGADEVYNQQRLNDINMASIKTVLTHTGLDVGEDGMTHQCIDYVGLFRNSFGWRVVVPADPNQTDRATRWMLKETGNVCLAMGRSVLPVVVKEDGSPYYGDEYTFTYGDIDVLREGKDAVILSMGHFAGRAIAACDQLAAEGISVKVLHCASPLGMDAKKLFELVGDKPLITCEDHHVNTGIGSIAAMMFARAGKAVRIVNLGVTHYGCSGPGSEVMAEMKLSPGDIADAVKGSLN